VVSDVIQITGSRSELLLCFFGRSGEFFEPHPEAGCAQSITSGDSHHSPFP